MENFLELQQIIYSLLKTQIQFGAYHAGERLPTMEDACRFFGVSIKTIRNAYQQLQQEGLISISKKIGVKVTVQYGEEEIERHIREFFIGRKAALIDLSQSIPVLLSGVQWLGYQNISPEVLGKIEQLALRNDLLPSYKLVLQLQLIYGALNNHLLLRLILQIYIFFLGPFLSVPGRISGLEHERSPLPKMIDFCKKKNWSQLRNAIETFEEQIYLSLCQFYDERIHGTIPEAMEVFQWSGYQKASQHCYTLGMEILIGISWGSYPAGSRLPSFGKLAEEKNVSVITIRRVISLLNSIGVTNTVNGVGTFILPLKDVASHCDFTSSIVRKRLLDFVQSLQILTLSCKQVAKITFSPGNGNAIRQCTERLLMLKQGNRCELTAYGILELITSLAPFSAIQTVYTALFHQLLWGYPIRNIRASQEALNKYYHSHLVFFLDCLEKSDIESFSTELETLLLSEFDYTVGQLVKLGIPEAAKLSIIYAKDSIHGK
ncbi:GntR family transcriptional regulator [Eisenbergiella sp.]